MSIPAMKGFTSLTLLPEEKVGDKITRRILVGEKEMIVFWSMRAGAHAAAHSHPHEQKFWVLKGTMEFRLGDERRVCGRGDLAAIPGGAEPEPWFPENTGVIDVSSPVLEDMLTGQDHYLRRG